MQAFMTMNVQVLKDEQEKLGLSAADSAWVKEVFSNLRELLLRGQMNQAKECFRQFGLHFHEPSLPARVTYYADYFLYAFLDGKIIDGNEGQQWRRLVYDYAQFGFPNMPQNDYTHAHTAIKTRCTRKCLQIDYNSELSFENGEINTGLPDAEAISLRRVVMEVLN